MDSLRRLFKEARGVYAEFLRDGGAIFSAALAYFMLFALAPGLVLLSALGARLLGRSAGVEAALGGLSEVLGPDLTDALVGVAGSAAQAQSSRVAGVVGFAILMGALILLFVQLQDMLNRMWRVAVAPGADPRELVRARAGQVLVLLIPFALLVVQTVAGALAAVISRLPTLGWLVGAVQYLGSPLAVVVGAWFAFFMIFLFLPDVFVPRIPALVAGAVAAGGWALGTHIFGLYVSSREVVAWYGAAGAVFVLILWLNYSSLLVLLCCKAMKLWVERHSGLHPRPYAALTRVTIEG